VVVLIAGSEVQRAVYRRQAFFQGLHVRMVGGESDARFRETLPEASDFSRASAGFGIVIHPDAAEVRWR
jgi:hypothetical protein